MLTSFKTFNFFVQLLYHFVFRSDKRIDKLLLVILFSFLLVDFFDPLVDEVELVSEFLGFIILSVKVAFKLGQDDQIV